MKEPLISIVIVNWNGLRFLKGCFESIYSQGFKPLEVIFVDNGSTDSSVEFVSRNFPSALIIENTENAGFARANNQGIKMATGKYVLTLNNDTVLERGFLSELAGAAEGSNEKTGMWAVKILSFDERDVIDSVGGLLIYPDGLAKGRGRLEKDSGQYDMAEEVFIPSACAGLYRRTMLDEVGLFDEDFFAYCEDTDLGLRARLAGWRAANVPKAVVYHYYSGTGGRYTAFKAYLVERNHLWVALKNFPPLLLALFPLFTGWRLIMQVYGIFAGKGAGGRFVEGFSRTELIKVFFKAYLGAFGSLPAVLFKRRAIQKKRTVASKEVLSWFRTYGISAKELVLKD